MNIKTKSLLGAMTPMEAARGRYMRAPDHPESGGDGIESFDNADVEVGGTEEIETNIPAKKPDIEVGAKPVAADVEIVEEEEEEEKSPENPEEKPAKKPLTAKQRIQQINRERRDDQRAAADREAKLLERLERLEKGLPAATPGDTQIAGDAPDPTDVDKYPLGHLDDRYIEDKLEWLAETKAAKRADAVLQRQQENDQKAAADAATASLLEKIDAISARGSEHFDDFQETVVDAAMRGDYPMEQATFEAAAEAAHGHTILHELASNLDEAKRVAKLSPFQQIKYVVDRDAELGGSAKPRKIPGATPPPSDNSPRGSSSRNSIRPDTDNLDDFNKLWEKAGKH